MPQLETKACQNCKNEFVIEPEDFDFYEKIKVPAPTFCPECRTIRRLACRNERALYKRKCDLCEEEKILMYHRDSPFTIYCKECWWSDQWDGRKFELTYNNTRPFFEQFFGLLRVVPRPGIVQQGNNPGCEYANRVTDNRNSYLVFSSTRAEDCRYGTWLNYSKDCMDCYNTQKSERCYECIDCFQCYNLYFSQECNTCNDSFFLRNCRNCSSCFSSVNLRNKSYCIFNKQYTKEDYQKILKELDLGNYFSLTGVKSKLETFRKSFIVPPFIIYHSTGIGNWIEDSKNAFKCFNCRNIENSRYCYSVFNAKDVMDLSYWGNTVEIIYESANIGVQAANVMFSTECWNQVIELQYCINCHNSHNLFGCVGLKDASYCILNKQYQKDEYESMVRKIKEDMKKIPYQDKNGRTYKYGDFFPIELNVWAYNETVAQEFFPLTKGKAIEMGFVWKETEKRNYQITVTSEELPAKIQDTQDSITKEIIGCEHKEMCNEQCTSAFKILPEELQFYKTRNLPLPRLCPNCRHYERLKQRNPLKLWHCKCQCAGLKSEARSTKSETFSYTNTIAHFHGQEPCPNEFETSYSPDRPEIVYCEKCYQSEVV